MQIRNYKTEDYERVATLYKDSSLYGGQFDEDRDSKDRLEKVIAQDPQATLVCESEGKIVGTISLLENSRTAWLFRFVVLQNEHTKEIAQSLFARATEILKERGHNQVLVYSPVGNENLDERYQEILGFEKGSNFTCYWKNI